MRPGRSRRPGPARPRRGPAQESRRGPPPPPRGARPPPVPHPSAPPTPARVSLPALPHGTLAPQPGRFWWTCRGGFDAHLFEELAWARLAPRRVGEALVESDPPRPDVTPAFARFGFAAGQSLEGDAAAQAQAGAAWLLGQVKGAKLAVQAFAPDTPAANPLGPQAEALREAVEALLPAERRVDVARAREEGAYLGVLLVAPGRVVVGGVRARDALSLAPGGRQRMRRSGEAPSRAAMKLEEALGLLPFEPGRGERCVDLGAAPGGWTQRLVARGARVTAVDPARLMPELARSPLVTHVQDSAFAYAPDEPFDWLFCDMAWRPLEVAQLLAKWGRRGWADHLVANIKLPMKDKNPLLHRVRHTLVEDGGWKQLQIRQLYHDRDEVTVLGRRH